MEFEWDDAKAALNVKKHGIRFPSAAGIFDDENRLEKIDAKRNGGEARLTTTGVVAGVEVVVVYTVRGDIVRMISARRATKHEREDYWKNR